MEILIWIIFGAIVGWAASHVMSSEGGLLWDVVVGVVGATVGGWIMHAFGGVGVTGFNIYSFLVALFGACVLIAIVRAVRSHV